MIEFSTRLYFLKVLYVWLNNEFFKPQLYLTSDSVLELHCVKQI